MSKIWELLNIDKIPKIKSKIDYKNCVGLVLNFQHKKSETIYKFRVLEYIKSYNYKGKQIHSQFKVEYIYLEKTNYKESIIKYIRCDDFIKKCTICGIIPSLNQWTKKENYWIGIDTKGRQFKFNTDNKETEYNILHSTWYMRKDNYIMTNNLYNTSQQWQLHKAIYFNCNKEELDNNIHMCIDHINNDRNDNRIDNLRLATIAENNKNKKTNNQYELVGLSLNRKGYSSCFMVEGYNIYTKVRYNLEEAEIDNLITQRYLGYRHNEDQFYRLNELSEDRVKEVTDLLDEKIKNNKHKSKKEKEYEYDYIEKNNLIGIKTFKRDGTPNEICWVDKYSCIIKRFEKDKVVVIGGIYKNNKYFSIMVNGSLNTISNYVLTKGVNLQNYRNYTFHIDHINQKTNENYRDNIEIATHKSNMMNKESKGYSKCERKDGVRYRIQYANNWDYFNLYIGGLKTPYFNTQEEAIAEFKRRKEIVNKYRFRIGWQGSKEDTMKVLDEVIDFAEEHKLDLDSAYIVWKGLDTEENIKNYLNGIDK